MNPIGERGFKTAEEAETAARKREMKSFAILRNAPQPFMQPEFAWISPIEIYMNRAIPATMSGISAVKVVAE